MDNFERPPKVGMATYPFPAFEDVRVFQSKGVSLYRIFLSQTNNRIGLNQTGAIASCLNSQGVSMLRFADEADRLLGLRSH